MTVTTDLLAPYESTLADPRRRSLARQLLDEALGICTCRRGAAWHARESVYAAAFTEPCAPARATPAELLTAGRYAMLFLLVEDSPAEQARTLAELLRGPITPATSADGEGAAQLHSLLADFTDRGLPTGRLCALLAELCSAIAAEAATDPTAPPASPEHLHLRRMATIGTYPYVECWRLLRGLPPADPGTPAGRLTDLAVEAAYLADDLLSTPAEQHAGPQHASGNTLLAGAEPYASARRSALIRYNRLVQQLTEAQGDPYAELLARITDGRLTVYADLAAIRYPGTPLELLPLLRRVRTPTE
ncbi:hypothetical protein CFP65_6171 [Kitasatospora sp. MMS16-BH015]|uniref:hypothetical protein n=1 Tax=Kitasatospora sp. MMS16-BH015 TaxID=2018025 RepID=UPI000CA266DC|nr:hypothetical protein [Kitasatospora sp. MMS16-BH015]AUG80838.1 hypothetical protein CFP65_6171 [Kitasatospora sp. MMS16-BH015]